MDARRAAAIEQIAYLSRSENRMAVLETLTETISKPGKPMPGYEPRELETRIGTSRATLSRILSEFEDREWAERTADGEYVATPQGQHVAVQFGPLVESLGTIQELGEAIAMIPASDLTSRTAEEVYSLQEFDDVTVHRPGAFDQISIGKYLGNLTRESSRHLSMGFGAPPPEYNEAIKDRLEAGDVPIDEAVYSGGVIDWYGPDTWPSREQVKTLLETTTWELYRYEGHMPCQLFIFDETVLVENSQADGVERGTFLESRNDTVRTWALDLFESYKAQSDEVTTGDLTE